MFNEVKVLLIAGHEGQEAKIEYDGLDFYLGIDDEKIMVSDSEMFEMIKEYFLRFR